MTFVPLAEPLERVRASTPREPLGFPGVGLGAATKATCPVGVPVAPGPAVPVLLTLTGAPWATVIEETTVPFTLAASVVAEGRKLTEDQLFTRFCTLTEPRPVARSYPAPALYPERTPYWSMELEV